MRILYVATDQRVPGRTGGSVHVLEVARGLAARGHDVHAVVDAEDGLPAREVQDGVTWHRLRWTPHHRFFRFRARAAVERLLAEIEPQVVLERYYNFGGEGVRAAHRRGVASLLEVNSPVVDHPGSLKAIVDRLLVVRPLKRYRERLCREATALVSPLPEIVPEFARAKTERVHWGANVEAFVPRPPDPARRQALGLPAEAVVVLFSGSFRPWHGVHVFEDAARRLRHRPDLFFLLAGGPRKGAASDYRGLHLGTVPYAQMPEVLAAADVGVAPYDTARLAQLQLGFYWSPLKIFEYMAAGLPTVTIPRPPLPEIVREGQEGRLFREGDGGDLARVVESLADAPGERRRLGTQARARVVERYSWSVHCAQLDAVLQRIAG